MRDDGRPADMFAWTRPWVPYGDDPFVWHDPSEDFPAPRAPAPANDVRPEAPVAAVAEAAAPAPSVSDEQPHVELDVWVELPAIEEKPKKSRSRRGRKAVEAAPVEPVVEAEATPIAEPAPEAVAVEAAPEPAPEAPPAKKPRARRTKAAAKAEPVAEAAPDPTPEPEPAAAPGPEPVPEPVVAAVEPPATPQPDPNEIGGPPPAPKRGWWRRG